MEYRIQASASIPVASLTALILDWYRKATRPPGPPVGAFVSSERHPAGQGHLPHLGNFLSTPILQTSKLSGSGVVDRTSTPLKSLSTQSLRGTTLPVTVPPDLLQTAIEWSIGPGVRLQKIGSAGGQLQDLFVWQENQVLVLERLSGHYQWRTLKQGWEGLQFTSPPVLTKATQFVTSPSGRSLDVAGMSESEKLIEAIRRAADRVAPALKQQVLDLATPESVAAMIVFAAAFIYAQTNPVGWVADAVLVVGGVFLDIEIAAVAELLYDFYTTARDARSEPDLDRAAQYFADAIAKVGIDVVLGLLFKKVGNTVKNRPGTQRPTLEPPKNGGTVEKPGQPVVVEEPAPTAKKPSKPAKPPKPQKPKAGSPEHKAQRWKDYQAKGGNMTYDRWSKQYDTNMRNAEVGLSREAQYRDAMGGVSETVKTPYTNRQIDVSIAEQDYMGQIKTGKVSLTEQAKIDITKDAFLVKRGKKVEYILEKGASKPFLEALKKNGIDYKIGSQIPE